MIFVGSILQVCDNSGVKRVKCIKILKKKNRSAGSIGSILIVVIKATRTSSKIKKKTLYKSILVRHRQNIVYENGNSIKFFNNAVILLNKKLNPIGTRIFGPVSNRIRKFNNTRLTLLCSKII